MGEFRTSDGVRLHYLESGAGPALVLLPGWSQTAAQFAPQLAGLADRFRVVALDFRGHGDSEKPPHGYRLARLATDLHELFAALGLRDVALLAHSMGCAVAWSHWELFGRGPVTRLILVDQPPVVAALPTLSEAERTAVHAELSLADLEATIRRLLGADPAGATRAMLDGMVTDAMPGAERERMLAQNLRFPRALAVRLLFETATSDWRDVLPRIDVPTLIVGGRASQIPWEAHVWTERQIPGARLQVLEAAEGGGHFAFVENPARFNRLVAEFLRGPG